MKNDACHFMSVHHEPPKPPLQSLKIVLNTKIDQFATDSLLTKNPSDHAILRHLEAIILILNPQKK